MAIVSWFLSFLLYRQMEKQSGGVFQRCTGKFREACRFYLLEYLGVGGGDGVRLVLIKMVGCSGPF